MPIALRVVFNLSQTSMGWLVDRAHQGAKEFQPKHKKNSKEKNAYVNTITHKLVNDTIQRGKKKKKKKRTLSVNGGQCRFLRARRG